MMMMMMMIIKVSKKIKINYQPCISIEQNTLRIANSCIGSLIQKVNKILIGNTSSDDTP